ncbi:hypothetical protein [Nocardia spumae]|uniref:hypothetical protein n=1 Tax=Nocardia spumae TaxID=2887190 RepID=UPI003555DD95
MLARRGYGQSLAYAVVKDELAAAAEVDPAASDPAASDPAASDPAASDPAASESGTEETADQAAELVRRALRTMPSNLTGDKVRNRLVGLLARRGYSSSVAYAVVKAALADGEAPG